MSWHAGAGYGVTVKVCPRVGNGRQRRACRRHSSAFTLIELLLILAILGVLAAIAVPEYASYIDRTKVGIAIGDIGEMSRRIKAYVQENGPLPATLADVNAAGRLDPWGAPYVYVNLHSVGISRARKNKNLVPINSDYDLYSLGKDGRSRPPLTARVSRDDVLRASDGKFIGLASNYDP